VAGKRRKESAAVFRPFPSASIKEEVLMGERVPLIVEDECIACGACEEICPEVFRVNESLGFAQVLNPGGAPEDKIQEAMDDCPVTCIHWEGEESAG
jgi:ferredoxin